MTLFIKLIIACTAPRIQGPSLKILKKHLIGKYMQQILQWEITDVGVGETWKEKKCNCTCMPCSLPHPLHTHTHTHTHAVLKAHLVCSICRTLHGVLSRFFLIHFLYAELLFLLFPSLNRLSDYIQHFVYFSFFI